MGSGGEVYIGAKGYCCEKTDAMRGGGKRYSYEKTDAVPIVVINEEKQEAHKTGYITLYTKLFNGMVCTSQK